MSKYRITTKNKYALPKEEYLTAIHYALRYPLWLDELRTLGDTSSGFRYDKEKVQTSITGGEVEDVAIRRVEIREKIDLIDGIIESVADGMNQWLRQGVCYGLTFDQLKAKNMPCERDAYYLMRRKFYYELSRRI